MIEKREKLIGIRFTKKEREVIETLAENRDLTLTDFIREAVFSHINNLTNNVGNIDVEFFLTKFDKMNDSINILKEYVKIMKREFDVYDLARIEHNLMKTNRELEL